jgi:hypothetical protein
MIGDASGTLDPVTHKVLHAVNGAIQGTMISLKHTGAAALAGAMGGLIAEDVAEFLPPDLSPQMRADVGRLSAATTAFFTNQDVNIATLTGTVAVENNHLRHPGIHNDILDGGLPEYYDVPEEEYQPVSAAQEMTEGEFVADSINRKYRERLRPEGHMERDVQRFTGRYHTLRLYDSSREMVLGPGHQRWERLSGLSLEGLTAERMQELDPHDNMTAKERQRAGEIIKNEYDHYQRQRADLGVGALFGVVGGGAFSKGRTTLTSSKVRNHVPPKGSKRDYGQDYRGEGWVRNKDGRWHHENANDMQGVPNKPNFTNEKLQKVANDLYRPRDQYPGGSAGLLRKEAAEGKILEHLEKCETRIINIQKILQNPKQIISRIDREAAEQLLYDLRDAINMAKGMK